MLQEATEDLHAPRLADLGEQIGQLRERRAALREPVEATLNAERDLLEAVKSEPLERLAVTRASGESLPRMSMRRSTASGPSRKISEQGRDAGESEGRLFGAELRRLLHGRAERAHELRAGLRDELAVVTPNGAFGVERAERMSFCVMAAGVG